MVHNRLGVNILTQAPPLALVFDRGQASASTIIL
jgi:hypothetical protein